MGRHGFLEDDSLDDLEVVVSGDDRSTGLATTERI